jgi:hypothetical protein
MTVMDCLSLSPLDTGRAAEIEAKEAGHMTVKPRGPLLAVGDNGYQSKWL